MCYQRYTLFLLCLAFSTMNGGRSKSRKKMLSKGISAGEKIGHRPYVDMKHNRNINMPSAKIRTGVFAGYALEDMSISDIKASFVRDYHAPINTISIIKNGGDSSKSEGLYGQPRIKRMIRASEEKLSDPSQKNQFDLIAGDNPKLFYQATLRILKNGIDLSRKKDAIVTKGTEYLVLFKLVS